VRHDTLGRGIGTMLINALIAACEARGYRQAFAMIAGTEPASVVLHARAGYLPCGTLVGAGWKQGKWNDVFIMQRKLNAGNETLPEGHI
jgi:phosphinothricin acetyltransferase